MGDPGEVQDRPDERHLPEEPDHYGEKVREQVDKPEHLEDQPKERPFEEHEDDPSEEADRPGDASLLREEQRRLLQTIHETKAGKEEDLARAKSQDQ
jgi:hypothetical protein